MSSKWMVVLVAVAVLGCGSAKTEPDARNIVQLDAAAVSCAEDQDCQTPPDMCSVAGTCNLTTKECEFPTKDCTALDGECTVGVCVASTGECVADAANETASCGDEEVCDAPGTCTATDPNVCNQTGSETHACTRYTCQNKECVGAVVQVTEACALTTNGLPCGAEVVSGCNTCSGFDATNPICDSSGTNTCTCTNYACNGGTCQAMASTCVRPCTRVTAGVMCKSTLYYSCQACNWGTVEPVCSLVGSKACDCTEYKCFNDVCSGFLPFNGCQLSCSRQTEDNVCGAGSGCSNGFRRDKLCTGGTCTGLGSCVPL